MKCYNLFFLLLVICSLEAMEVNENSKQPGIKLTIEQKKDEKATLNYTPEEGAFLLACGKKLHAKAEDVPYSYEDVKKLLFKVIPQLNIAQHYFANPLLEAIRKRDFDFIVFLLYYKAIPSYRGFDGLNAYDILNPDSYFGHDEDRVDELKSYKKLAKKNKGLNNQKLFKKQLMDGYIKRLLQLNEAEKLFWDSTGLDANKPTFGYAEYKENMRRALPILNFVQHRYHDPLPMAVHYDDIEFACFLLNHGASPLFISMNGRSAYEYTANETTHFENQRPDRDSNKREEIRRIFDEWIEKNKKKGK